jgi:hypothetical protein
MMRRPKGVRLCTLHRQSTDEFITHQKAHLETRWLKDDAQQDSEAIRRGSPTGLLIQFLRFEKYPFSKRGVRRFPRLVHQLNLPPLPSSDCLNAQPEAGSL